jgi:hypothetical protein
VTCARGERLLVVDIWQVARIAEPDECASPWDDAARCETSRVRRDIFVQHIPEGITTVDDIPDDWEGQPAAFWTFGGDRGGARARYGGRHE